jgi:hypothetical protein
VGRRIPVDCFRWYSQGVSEGDNGDRVVPTVIARTLFFLAWALSIASARARPALAEDPAHAVSRPVDPLAMDYVDLEAHGGVAWLGSAGDDRWTSMGPTFGTAVDFGRAPYWGGVYVDVAIYEARSGVVDPTTGTAPRLVTTSAGWHGKAAVRLARSFYFMPSVGGGFGVLDYDSGTTDPRGRGARLVRYLGLGLQLDARFVYAWRFAALTIEPLRVSTFLLQHRSGSVGAPSDSGPVGVSSNGASLGASLGLSLDLSALAIAIWERVRGVARQVADLPFTSSHVSTIP